MPEEAYEPPFNPSDSYSDTSTTTTHPPLHHNRRQATTRKRRSFCFCDDPDCGCRADHSICCHCWFLKWAVGGLCGCLYAVASQWAQPEGGDYTE